MSKIELLQVLIEKEVNIRFLKFCVFSKRKGLIKYNSLHSEAQKLTFEEYDTFKAMFKNT